MGKAKRKKVMAEKEEIPIEEQDESKSELKAGSDRDGWRNVKLVDIIDCDSLRSCDIMQRRDQQRYGWDTRIYKKLRTPGEGTGYCLMVYEAGK